jgi:hypothetical protein
MDQVLNQLQTLTEKFKQNKRLGDKESKTAREQLELLLTNPEYLDQAFKLIPHLPPEVSCQALLAAWQAGDREYREKLVQILLEDRELADRAELKRKLSLIKEFIPVDSQVALRLLIDVADRLTEGGRTPPARQFVSQFRQELMDTKKLLSIPLGENNISSRDISSIAGMVLMGMIEGRETCTMEDTVWKHDFLDWLSGYKSKVTLGQKLVREAEKVTKNWPEDLQRQCVALGLITMVQTQFTREQQMESYLRPEHRREVTAVSPEVEKSQIKECPRRAAATLVEMGRNNIQTAPVAQRESRDGLYTELNSKLCLEWLAEYIDSIEKENEALRKNIKLLEEQFNLEKKHRIDRERHIAELQAELQRQQALVHETNEKISMLERETRELQNSLHNEKLAREEEVKHLKERIDRECNYVIEEFKGKLCDRLYIHYKDYLDAKERSTTEVADHLKYLLERIFRELLNEGIIVNAENY